MKKSLLLKYLQLPRKISNDILAGSNFSKKMYRLTPYEGRDFLAEEEFLRKMYRSDHDVRKMYRSREHAPQEMYRSRRHAPQEMYRS